MTSPVLCGHRIDGDVDVGAGRNDVVVAPVPTDRVSDSMIHASAPRARTVTPRPPPKLHSSRPLLGHSLLESKFGGGRGWRGATQIITIGVAGM
ncbi:hypothetical protein, partial [Mycolicibacterium sp.]|uniref:hypothetical protein n=1 Tax=Mycolicibacterium sp. TaxID=2320850 RepID=UPI003D0CD018